MNLLIIVVKGPADGDMRQWRDSLHAVQEKAEIAPREIWCDTGTAVLGPTQIGTVGSKLLDALRRHRLRYHLYGACDYPKELAERLESC